MELSRVQLPSLHGAMVMVATVAMAMAMAMAATREVELPGWGDMMTVCLMVIKRGRARSIVLVPTQPLRGSLALGLRCGLNRGGERASPGSLENLNEEAVGRAWPAVADAPVSPDLPSPAGMVYGHGTDATHAREVGPSGIGTNERG